MSEANKANARRYIEEVWNNQNLDAIDELLAPDFVDHELPPGLPPGRDGAKAFANIYLSAFPDTNFTIEDLLADGDKVVIRWSATGTHTGELMGIPATGVKATVTGMDINRYVDGKGVEHWGLFDEMGMMQQLGVVPTPGQ